MDASTAAAHAGAFRLSAAAPGQFAAAGPLVFATATAACVEGLAALGAAEGGELEVDCGGITATDSAGLAVLLEWLGAARRAGRRLRYTRLPEGLKAVSRISEVEELLERGV
ncbi:MAG TPA: STAS domain-containing protein [Candidatus Dormibacteraeota bacterium]|nr:STAS domain-containing protein [Candidatus Dormibacteraeota bacterium]